MLSLTKCMDLTQILTQTYGKSNSNDHQHTEFVQSKFNMGTLISLFWLIDWLIDWVFLAADWSLSSMCPGLAESNDQLAHVSVDQYLKFCDDTTSFATLSTLNNSQDLDPDYIGG